MARKDNPTAKADSSDTGTGQSLAGAVEPAVHAPPEAIALLVEKLSQPRRHLSLLLGAGASIAAGLPDLAGLAVQVGEELGSDDRPDYQRLAATRNIEELLSFLRAARALLASAGGIFDGLSAERASALDRAVTRTIATILSASVERSEPHVRLVEWIGRSLRPKPVELFTTNYDLLIERAFDEAGVPYFDGFVGQLRGRFRPDLIEPDEADERERLPAGWARLWKVHGSVSWVIDTESKQITRLVAPGASDEMLAIYPTAEKYEQSRRMPFLALTDRLRRALASPESTTVTVGYSFGDAHLNELIFDAVARHQRSEVIALFFGDIPVPVRTAASKFANLSVYGATEAVLSGQVGSYGSAPSGPGWDGTRATVGDFRHFAQLLPSVDQRTGLIEVDEQR